uniref:Variant surface glycoprotein 411 n=1 Tax=Trypanosoma brucei TaxID=5691 RepID=M4T005_9TRYP|nr:variant surface glycoprotein 411 [Trypanosoma brucei]
MFHAGICLLLLAITTAHRGESAIAENSNERPRAALCSIIAIGGPRAKLPTAAKKEKPVALEGLLELNTTIASAEWLDIFRDEKNKEQARDYAQDKMPKETDWDQRWATWKAHAAKVLKASDHQNLKQKHKVDKLTAKQLKAYRRQVQQLAAEAEETYNEALKEALADHITDETAIQKAINQAIYSSDGEPTTPFTDTKPFGDASGGNRQTLCESGTGKNKATNALAWLVCICAADSSNTANAAKACTGTTAAARQWTPTGEPDQNVLGEMLGLCDRYSVIQLTSADLRSRLNTVAGMIKRTSGAGYFGEFLQTQCDGQTNNGMCVKITALTTAAGSPKTAIPWMQQLYDLADKLEKHEKAVTVWKKAQAEIASKFSTAQRALYAEPIPEPDSTTAKGMEDKNKEVNRVHKEQECEAIQKAAECTTNGNCKWEGGDKKDGPHCKLNETNVEQKATQAAGTGDKTETEKCKGKSQTDCEKATECKWEGKECKDSSILVAKQFALSVVSAAFVALLF